MSRSSNLFNLPGRMVDCCLLHTINILKAIGLTVNLVYLGTRYVHPVTHPFFLTFGNQLAVLAETLSYLMKML